MGFGRCSSLTGQSYSREKSVIRTDRRTIQRRVGALLGEAVEKRGRRIGALMFDHPDTTDRLRIDLDCIEPTRLLAVDLDSSLVDRDPSSAVSTIGRRIISDSMHIFHTDG